MKSEWKAKTWEPLRSSVTSSLSLILYSQSQKRLEVHFHFVSKKRFIFKDRTRSLVGNTNRQTVVDPGCKFNKYKNQDTNTNVGSETTDMLQLWCSSGSVILCWCWLTVRMRACFLFKIPDSVATNTSGKCPNISLKPSSGFTLTNSETQSWTAVSGLVWFFYPERQRVHM